MATTRLGTKIVLSGALVAAAVGSVGVGAFAAFNDTKAVNQTVSSGTLVIDPIATSGTNNRLSIGASGIAPGDTIQRSVLIKNSGSVALASTGGLTLTTTAAPSSLLDTDGTNGLQMVIDRCSVPWTEAGTAPAYTYTCGGTTTSVIASRAVVGNNLDLSGGISTAAGASNYLRVTLTLPSGAGNTFQGLTSTVNYAFTANQRTGQAQ